MRLPKVGLPVQTQIKIRNLCNLWPTLSRVITGFYRNSELKKKNRAAAHPLLIPDAEPMR